MTRKTITIYTENYQFQYRLLYYYNHLDLIFINYAIMITNTHEPNDAILNIQLPKITTTTLHYRTLPVRTGEDNTHFMSPQRQLVVLLHCPRRS